jgi:hypothetical protein
MTSVGRTPLYRMLLLRFGRFARSRLSRRRSGCRNAVVILGSRCDAHDWLYGPRRTTSRAAPGHDGNPFGCAAVGPDRAEFSDARHSAVGPRHPSCPPLTVRWRVRLVGTPEAILRLIQNGYLTIALPMRRGFAEAPTMRAEFASAISRRAAIMRGSGRPNWPDIFGIPPCLGLNTAIVVASSPRAWRSAVAKRFSGSLRWPGESWSYHFGPRLRVCRLLLGRADGGAVVIRKSLLPAGDGTAIDMRRLLCAS